MIVQTRSKQAKKKGTATTVPDPIQKLKIWVLYPYLVTEDPNLQYYYDFSQSLAEYTRVFNELKADWTWEKVTLQNYKELISTIKKRSGRKIPLVLNLCDGDEVNGTPGISIIHELDKQKLLYTGADAAYYNITTSKIPMKKAFDTAGVPNARWEVVDADPSSTDGICERLGAPLILKPAVSGGSMGVSVKNVVNSDQELRERITEINKGYRGWNLLADGLIVEQFISGPEYTTLVVGSSTDPSSCVVYAPVERIFHASLPEQEKFLSFDRLWEIYEDENAMPGDENFYNYHQPDPALVAELEKISLAAYLAVGGMGYGRLDIRMDTSTGRLYMLEVNAQCGLSEDEDFTSIGAILRLSNETFRNLVRQIITDAFHRRKLLLA